MNEPTPHERALEAFELDDVFVIELRCNVARDFNQSAHHAELRFQHRFSPQSSGLVQSRLAVDSNEQLLIFRYYVEGNVRLIKPETPIEREEFTDADIMAEIQGVIAVDYRASKDLRDDVEAISAFGPNVVFHAWPYWRAMVVCRAAELRLPRIVLPMMRQAKRSLIKLQMAGEEKPSD